MPGIARLTAMAFAATLTVGSTAFAADPAAPLNKVTKDLEAVRGHALVIHAGGDNFSDQPAPLGGGGARIACGAIK
jgi:Cu-Zn family superoxide dismutase